MLSMAQRIDNSRGGGHLHLAYDAGNRTVSISLRNGDSRSSTSFDVEEFDKVIEQYMYLRQYTNGRRIRG